MTFHVLYLLINFLKDIWYGFTIHLYFFLQAIYPGMVMGIPIMVTTICVQFKLEIPMVGLYSATSMSLIPLVNAATVITLIPSFRRRMFYIVKGCYGHGKVSDYSNSVSPSGKLEKTTHVASVSQNFKPRPIKNVNHDEHVLV